MGNEILKNIHPRISIVTPVKNGVKYIEETMLSVINQGYPNLEYIVIDGGSTDGTVEIIKKYEKHISYWVSEPDKGQLDAVNKGFARSTGEIISWLCASDILLPGALFTVANIFQSFPQVEVISGITTIIGEKGNPIYSGIIPQFNRIQYLYSKHIFFAVESTFWKKTLWDKVGPFDINYKYGGEHQLWIKFLRTSTIYPVQSILGAYRITEDSIASKYSEKLKETAMLLREQEIKSDPYCKTRVSLLKFFEKISLKVNNLPFIRFLWYKLYFPSIYKYIIGPLPPVIVWDFEQKKWVMKK